MSEVSLGSKWKPTNKHEEALNSIYKFAGIVQKERQNMTPTEVKVAEKDDLSFEKIVPITVESNNTVYYDFCDMV